MLPALAGDGIVSPITIVLDFAGPHDVRSTQIMERETEAILKDSGLRLEWKLREEAAQKSFSDLVVLRFKGSCVLQDASPAPSREFGSLAFTYTTDGVVQPFGEVSCDTIGAFLLSEGERSAHEDPQHAMGVALGRVVAHELVHMLLGSEKHAEAGVFKPGLTAEQLVSGELQLDEGDLDRLRAH
jgi:hypothetical protein